MGLRTGLIDIATIGAAVQGPSTPSAQNASFTLVAHPANTLNIYVGNDGSDDVSVTTGVALAPGDQLKVNVKNLSELWFDTQTDGNDCTWFFHG